MARSRLEQGMEQRSRWRKRPEKKTFSCSDSPWNRSKIAAPGTVRRGTMSTSPRLARLSTLFLPTTSATMSQERSNRCAIRFYYSATAIMHLADLKSYVEAQDRLGLLYRDPGAWAQKAILNVASSGKFSADRTIHEYTTEIWKVEPCPIP